MELVTTQFINPYRLQTYHNSLKYTSCREERQA